MKDQKTQELHPIAPEIQKLIRSYVTFKMAKGMLQTSIDTYTSHLNRLGAFMTAIPRYEANGITLDDIINYYTVWTQDNKKPLSSKTIATGHTIITDFLEHVIKQLARSGNASLTYADLATWKEYRPKLRKTIKPVAWKKVAQIFTEIAQSKTPPERLTPNQELLWWRRNAILSIMFCTALRVSNVCNLNKSILSKNENIVKVKGGKDQSIYLSNEAIYFCRQYISLREDSEPALFVTHDRSKPSHRITVDTIQDMLKLEKITGFTPHQIRRFSATEFYDATGDIEAVRSLLGHSSISTTQIYIANNEQLQERKIKAKHPAFRN